MMVADSSLRFIIDGLAEAFSMIVRLDPYLISVVGVSVRVSGVALLVSVLFSATVASLISFRRFLGRGSLQLLVHTGMGVPSVIVGLVVLMLLTKKGPLGPLNLIWTPTAMIISQFVLITPLITGIMVSSLSAVDRSISDAAYTLGATHRQQIWTVIREARFGFITAVMAGFGRAVAEVGSVLMVGGNIVWSDGLSYTRTLTTAMVVEARKGKFESALALGIILIAIVLALNLLAHWVQKRETK